MVSSDTSTEKVLNVAKNLDTIVVSVIVAKIRPEDLHFIISATYLLAHLETCSMASRKKTNFISLDELILKSSRY